MKIDISPHGYFEKKTDYFDAYGIQTAIGSINAQIDGVDFDVQEMRNKILTTLNRIEEIDKAARNFLNLKASQDVKLSGGLIEPSLLFVSDCGMGDFSIFYSGTSVDDETFYGVEFQNFEAFDLTIGD